MRIKLKDKKIAGTISSELRDKIRYIALIQDNSCILKVLLYGQDQVEYYLNLKTVKSDWRLLLVYREDFEKYIDEIEIDEFGRVI